MPVTSSKTRSVEHLGMRADVRQAGHGAPLTRVARSGYSIAQADAAGLGTECTKARSSRAAKGDSGKIHCNAGTRERCKLLCGDVAKQQLQPEGQESLARVARASGAGGRSGAGSRAER